MLCVWYAAHRWPKPVEPMNVGYASWCGHSASLMGVDLMVAACGPWSARFVDRFYLLFGDVRCSWLTARSMH